MKTIAILDYTNGKVIIRTIPEDTQGDGEEIHEAFCDELGLQASDTYFLITSNDNFLDIE